MFKSFAHEWELISGVLLCGHASLSARLRSWRHGLNQIPTCVSRAHSLPPFEWWCFSSSLLWVVLLLLFLFLLWCHTSSQVRSCHRMEIDGSSEVTRFLEQSGGDLCQKGGPTLRGLPVRPRDRPGHRQEAGVRFHGPHAETRQRKCTCNSWTLTHMATGDVFEISHGALFLNTQWTF